MSKELKVIELFAGVGGFRIGMINSSNKVDNFKINFVWSNQWEPSTKTQHASDIYIKRFGNYNHSNEDISTVKTKDIPECDMLVGGFPCQDYSVARPKNKSKGLEGKKGVLFWDIYRILKDKKNIDYVFLENVDRLLSSPSKQKGKDFAIILKSLMQLGFIVEWRVINAAEYGMPQKRRRTYIFAYNHNSDFIKKNGEVKEVKGFLLKDSLFAKSFPIIQEDNIKLEKIDLSLDIFELSDNFNKNKEFKKPFHNCGIAYNDFAYSFSSKPNYNGKYKFLKDVLINEEDIEEEFYIQPEQVEKWRDPKTAKAIPKVNKKTGISYIYKQGAMNFPEPLDSPSRTIITSEGGKSPSRTTHVIEVNGRFRRLHPIEIERLNMFPDNHTEGVSNSKRAFLMGNALVVGVIEQLTDTFLEILNKD